MGKYISRSLILLILFSFTSFIGHSQQVVNDDLLKKVLNRTPDRMVWNEETYFMSDSPLSRFNGYDKLYPNLPMVEVDFESLFAQPYIPGKLYFVTWILKGNILYLAGIDNYGNDASFPKKEDYQTMERLVDTKFSQDIPSVKNEKAVSEYGVIPANWFSGELLVKKTKSNKESTKEWFADVYHKLTFKNGKLIKEVKVRSGKPSEFEKQ